MEKIKVNDRLILEIAHLYYEDKLTQGEIAARLRLSRPKVSRLLGEAHERGFVKVLIIDPSPNLKHLEEELAARFGLKAVLVVSAPERNDILIKQAVAREAGFYLTRFFEPGDIIGVTWGTSLNELQRYFPSCPCPGSVVIQLNGGVDANSRNYATEIVTGLAQKFHGKAYILPCPAIVANSRVRNAILQDNRLRELLELGIKANKAIISIGVPGKNSVLVEAGYFSEDEIEEIKRKGAVGEICSRYFDQNGVVVDQELDKRTIGISLADLTKIDCVIGIAAGINKAASLLASLRGRYLDVLITDVATARDTLKLASESELAKDS